jgi:hypothetical protein
MQRAFSLENEALDGRNRLCRREVNLKDEERSPVADFANGCELLESDDRTELSNRLAIQCKWTIVPHVFSLSL